MAIASAVQKGTMVHVYGDKGQLLFTRNGVLQGYTGTTVSVKFGGMVQTYDDRGSLKFTR
jgi:hypothetical protein